MSSTLNSTNSSLPTRQTPIKHTPLPTANILNNQLISSTVPPHICIYIYLYISGYPEISSGLALNPKKVRGWPVTLLYIFIYDSHHKLHEEDGEKCNTKSAQRKPQI